jgi:hypothetical protein
MACACMRSLCCCVQALIVDYAMDEQLEWTRGDFLKLRSHDEICELMDKGYSHMERLHERGLVSEKWDSRSYAL